MAVPYPTNQYTTINLTVDNIADFREKRVKPIVDVTTGLTTTDHPTRTLYDLTNEGSDTTDYLWVMNSQQIPLLGMAIASMSSKQLNYLAKEKQLKILRLTERMRKVAFEVQRLNAEGLAAGSTSVQHLPAAPESRYPSSKTIRSYPNQ